MKNFITLGFCVFSIILFTSLSHGDGGQTLGCSLARSMATDSRGVLYAMGSESRDCNHRVWIVKKSLDHGQSWTVIDSFTGDKNFSTEPAAIAIGPKDSVIVVGKSEYKAKTGQTLSAWVTRISTDGQNWKTKDKIKYPSLSWARASGVIADKIGNIYVLGSVQEGYITSNKPSLCHCHILVRKSSNLGQSWSTIAVKENFYLWSVAMAISPAGEIYIVSQAQTADMKSTVFLVEKSSDQGQTWKDVDSYNMFPQGLGSHATTIFIDEKGAVYTAGIGIQTARNTKHWILRKSEDGGATWSIIDDFKGDGLEFVWPQSIYADGKGNVLVAGYGYRQGGKQVNWIVRKFTDGVWKTSDDMTSINKNAGALGIWADSTSRQIFIMGWSDSLWAIKAYNP